MDGRNSKELDPGKQPPDIPSEFNKNVPIGLLHRELGYKQKQRAVPLEFQAAAEDRLVTKDYEELRCELPGASRSTFLMVFSPDGKKVASTHGNHNVYVTDLTTGKNVNTLSGHPRTPWCIAFHPSSNQILASGCLGGQVRVWDLHGGSEVWTADGQTVIASLAFHPTDRLLVIATYNELHFWDWSQPEPFAKCYTNNEKEKVRYVAFDQLGHKLITGISNAPVVQTQWDRVTTTSGPHPSMNNPPTSQSSPSSSSAAGQSHHQVNTPERERRITICYRSLVEQYEQLVQRYFDLSRSRSIPTMDRGTDPMDLEAETSSSSTQTQTGPSPSAGPAPGPSRRREMGTSTGDVAGTSSGGSGGVGSSGSSGSAISTNLSDVPPFDFARARAIVERMTSSAPYSGPEQGAGSNTSLSTTETAESSPVPGEGAPPSEESGVADRNRNLLSDTISLNSAGTINISRTQNNAANPGVTLNIPVVENNRLANTINMINNAMNDMHTVIIADTGRQEPPSGADPGANNSTRDVGVGPPGDSRVRVHIRTYEVTQSPSHPRFSYLRRTNPPSEPNSQGPTPSPAHQPQDNPPPMEGPPWQRGRFFSRLHQHAQPQDSPPPMEGPPWLQQQGRFFSRLHQHAQPASPSTLPSERPRRFFVSPRSAFQPRTPRLDQDERRYVFPRRSASSNPPAEPADHPDPEPERSGSISPPVPSRSRMDMTDVGVRYGIQLLSRHIDNMQRLCRARLEILQLQQIRRMWEDLQRQIRSLHVAVRESSLALTGTSDPSASAELRRHFDGTSASSAEQIDGTSGDSNAGHIPSVSQMMESARISDGSPRPDRPPDETPGSSSHALPLNLVRNLLRIQQGERILNGPPTSQRNSDGNINNRNEGERNGRSGGDHAAGDSSRRWVPEARKRAPGGTVSASTSRTSPTCTVRILNLPQRMKIVTGMDLGLRGRGHPAGRGSGGIQKDHCGTRPGMAAMPGMPGSSLSAGASSSQPDTECALNLSRSNTSKSGEASEPSRNNPGPASSPGAGAGPGPSAGAEPGHLRTGFWLVSTMSSVSPSTSGISTTSTAGSSTATVPSSSGSSNPRSHQLLQQRLLRISRKIYLRRPRLLALAPRSARRQSSSSRGGPGLFRHNEMRRPWFMQSVVRSQRRSTNTASQVGSNASADSGEGSSHQAGGQEADHGSSSRTSPKPRPSSGESSSGYASSSQESAQPRDGGDGGSGTSGTGAAPSCEQETPPPEPPPPPPPAPPTNPGRPEGEGSSAGNTQHETSTSESLRAMIVRLERLVQQQREQREQARTERERSSRESQGPSRRPSVWELRDVSSSSWLPNYNNSGSDSDSSPESERQQPWDRLGEERLPSSLQNEMYGGSDPRHSGSGSRHPRSSHLDLDWEWTRESTRLRARQVLSLMVESLTQFFEENGLSHNTPHAVLDEQIYNLYVLLQLALELTDLLLAQLVSTRRELEHQWVHRLRSPVALDATLPGDNGSSSDRTRDREQRARGRQYCGGMMYRRYHRHRGHGDGGPERPERDRSSERGSSRGRGECSRRLSSRMMNCLAKHNHSGSTNSGSGGGTSSGSSVPHGPGGPAGPAGPAGLHSRRPVPLGRNREPSPSSSSDRDRDPDRERGGRDWTRRPPGEGGIMVRVQQYETRTTTTAAQNTRAGPGPGPAPDANGNVPQQHHQQHDAFTVPLVRVNDILIPDTSMLNHQPWTRPRSPPPRPNSPFRNPFALNVPHEHRMLGAWHELFPYGPGSNWRPRFLHPRYMGHNVYGEDQEDVYHGHPGENFNFIRDTVIITDAPMSPNHRIQVWDFSNLNIPDISNAEKNMIVPECKIHNDASVDVSRDGRLLVTLLPSGRLSITTKLGVYSLQWESLGQCLYTTSFDQSAVSVSLSPASRHLLVGLATRRVALLPNDRHTMAQIFRLEGARLGQAQGQTPGRGRSGGTRGRLCHLRDIEQGREQGYTSLNCIRWAPGPGQGFVYGTNTGQLKVLR